MPSTGQADAGSARTRVTVAGVVMGVTRWFCSSLLGRWPARVVCECSVVVAWRWGSGHCENRCVDHGPKFGTTAVTATCVVTERDGVDRAWVGYSRTLMDAQRVHR